MAMPACCCPTGDSPNETPLAQKCWVPAPATASLNLSFQRCGSKSSEGEITKICKRRLLLLQLYQSLSYYILSTYSNKLILNKREGRASLIASSSKGMTATSTYVKVKLTHITYVKVILLLLSLFCSTKDYLCL